MEVVENWLYPLPDPPKRIREKPMQVLALGMSRSGTDSLCRALTILGYDHVYHGFDIVEPGRMTWGAWTKLGRRKFGTSGSNDTNSGIGRDDFDAIIGHCEAVTDQPCALFAPELIEAYPEAKVILNYRDTDAWFQSCCNSFFPLRSRFRSLVLTWFNTELYWNFRYAKDCFRPYFHDSFIHHAKWVYEEHSAKIRGLAPPDRFLEWKIGDGWEPLCRFLDKPIPAQDFPTGNSPEVLIARHAKYFEKNVSAAKRNFGIFILCLGLVVAYLVQRFFY